MVLAPVALIFTLGSTKRSQVGNNTSGWDRYHIQATLALIGRWLHNFYILWHSSLRSYNYCQRIMFSHEPAPNSSWFVQRQNCIDTVPDSLMFLFSSPISGQSILISTVHASSVHYCSLLHACSQCVTKLSFTRRVL